MTHTFGEFRLDPATRQVLRGSRAIPLSPKAFALLQLLLSEHPRAMSKRELFEKVWPGVFVSDATLASVVAELRRVLSDSARQPRYIRTVHRFGYAFCGKAIEEPSAQLSSEWELVWKGGRIPPHGRGECGWTRCNTDAIVSGSKHFAATCAHSCIRRACRRRGSGKQERNVHRSQPDRQAGASQ